MLHGMGHEVSGISLDPQPGALFERAGIQAFIAADTRSDLRVEEETVLALRRAAPDVVVHLAAQPLVRKSYADPRTTFETNVLGTLNLLQAVAETGTVKAAVIVTTDKVYRNVGKARGYIEDDPLGGLDPYSASKAMADILATSWASSFNGCSIGIARAGNVIGGGDVSPDRLLPDLVRSFTQGSPARLRAPSSVRPWQHVLDCLQGYMRLVDHLLSNHVTGDAWNFGPDAGAFKTVEQATTRAAAHWGPGASWETVADNGPHEEAILTLNSDKARSELGWTDYLSFDEAIQWTIQWEKDVLNGRDPREVTQEQIADFAARSAGGGSAVPAP